MHAPTPVGTLLRHWRTKRRMSQLDLSQQAEVSTRHVSFIETGRSRPSREMVLVLCSALDVPLRERNVLLQSGGFAPAYRESALEGPDVAPVRQALEFLLQRHEPYPAVVIDPQWNVRMHNQAHLRMMGSLLPEGGVAHVNLLHALFDPKSLRPIIKNFETAARMLLTRTSREAISDERSRKLLEELLAYPNLPEAWSRPLLDPPAVLVPLIIQAHGVDLTLFSTITTLGTAMDVTLQELRIETFFAADEATRAFFETP